MREFSGLTIALLGAFLLVGVFGFVGMLDSNMHSGGLMGCIASLTRGAESCPVSDNGFSFGLFHTEAFKTLVLAVLASVLALIWVEVLGGRLKNFLDSIFKFAVTKRSSVPFLAFAFQNAETHKWYCLTQKRAVETL